MTYMYISLIEIHEYLALLVSIHSRNSFWVKVIFTRQASTNLTCSICMLELSQLLVYCTPICSFFNILSISIILWFLTISILNFYCFRGWEVCICSLVLFTNARCFRFIVKSDVLLQTILQCCDAIFQY